MEILSLNLLNGDIISINNLGEIFYVSLDDCLYETDRRQIKSDELLQLFESSNYRLTRFQQVFNLLGINYFDLKSFLESSFSLDFNPLPQLRKKFEGFKWEFSHNLPLCYYYGSEEFSAEEKTFKIILVTYEGGEKGVEILPPK